MSNTGSAASSAGRALAPTLVVGLGGLGREVVFRTRRQLYERYRRTGVPVASFLWLDHNTNIDPTPELPARVARKVMLDPSRCISLTLDDDAVDAALADPSGVPGGGDWLATEKLAATKGEARSRALGRLAFHLKQDEVAERLRTLAAEIDSEQAHQAAAHLGYETAPGRLEVVIVTSLAGGLGSGGVLSLARLVRRELPNAHVRGVFFLSGLFMAHDVARRQLAMANGYASALELHAAQSGESPAPFDALALIDRENADGNRPIDPLEPLEMVAQSLSIELSRSDAAAGVRAVRYAAQTGTGFASFGQASMAPGGGRLRSAAAYLLGAELLSRWAQDDGCPEAAACGLADGWPDGALAQAAADLEEEFETYDIPPVEERNFPLPAPEDLSELLLTHLRAELDLDPDVSDDEVFAGVSERFPAQAHPPSPETKDDPWEHLLDRFERFCRKTCSHFDHRMAGAEPVLDAAERAEAVARLRSWSEPWAPFVEGAVDPETFLTVQGSGMPEEAPLVRALGGDVLAFHPGTILRYRETPGLPPRAFLTLVACRDGYLSYRADHPERLAHRHTVADPESLPDPLAR